jgi:acetyl-CoA synthetase
MRFGTGPVKQFDRSSLRILGSVGEPINPEAWEWLYHEVGEGRCPIIDTYWQTESGGILLSPLPGATPLKPGSATFPMFGIEPALLDPLSHKELPFVTGEEQSGALVIKRSWPGLARTILGDHARYKEVYFNSKEHPNAYVTGDSARRDADGYWWIIGRMDDVVNVSGHRIGSAEVESAILGHPFAAEAAVVGIPHEIKGSSLFVFISLKEGKKGDEKFIQEVKVRDDEGTGSTFVVW